MPVPLKSQNAKAGPGPSTRQAKAVKGKPKSGKVVKGMRRQMEAEKFKALEDAALNFVAPPNLELFSDLPVSDLTKRGLKKAFFVKMTDIQTKSIPISLKDRDVLGAARTGSGKTLAFLIPVLETLYRNKWGPQDGLGALILSPTRELAIQTFDVLRAIGGYHSFSAGLVIGGKNVKDEAERLTRMNILVATPGRLLQHMDQTVGFECDNLQILVLDEADRILDMGFAKALNAILGHLPKTRQTLLFSATQTDSVKDLARLSLKSPEMVGVKEEAHDAATPKNLAQYYLVCTLDKKLDTLFSFIKTHLEVKAIVFLSSCKQVQFVYETFCKLHPGIPLLHLHGKQKQAKRLDIFQRFTSMKSAFLLATDIAARGLDFPAVDWVVQLDAPEDSETYIHRVGRTARYQRKGQSLLFLLPSEEDGMLQALGTKAITLENIQPKENKTINIQNQLQSFAFQDPGLKYLGQRAFVSYVRSVHLHRDKDIFKVTELPLKEFAASLGLPGAPKVKFINKDVALRKKNAQHVAPAPVGLADHEDSGAASSDEEETRIPHKEFGEPISSAKDKSTIRTKYDKMFERRNQDILSEHYGKLVDRADDDLPGSGGEEGDFITLKRANHELPPSLQDPNIVAENLSKRKRRSLASKKALAKNAPNFAHKLVFDDDGNARDAYAMENDVEFRKGDALAAGRAFAETERARLKDADVRDKQVAKEKKQEKKRRRKEREAAERGDTERMAPVLIPVSDDGYTSPTFDLSDASDDDEATQPPPKRRRGAHTDAPAKSASRVLMEDEELALRLLHGE